MTAEESLSLQGREVISLIGGGGKTTLMFALGRELSSSRKGILLTTTTKIWEPAPSSSFALCLTDELSPMGKWVQENLNSYPFLLVACRRMDDGKLQGIPPQWVHSLHSINGLSTILVEADGAAGRSLKAPREGEPVWPPDTTLALPVIGIDAVGCPLDERHVFRSRIAMEILRKAEGTQVTEEMIAQLISESLKSKPEIARVIPFINKTDLPGGPEKGRSLAQTLLRSQRLKCERVILSQAQSPSIINDIICR